jgi:hypothetical protein
MAKKEEMAIAVPNLPKVAIDILKWNGYAVQATQLADNIKIVSQETMTSALESVKKIKVFYKEAEEARKTILKPFGDFVDRVNATFKPITKAMEDSEKLIKIKMSDYLEAEKQKEQKRLAAERAEYEKQLRQAEAERKAFDMPVEAPEPPKPIEAPKPVVSEHATMHTRIYWHWKLKYIKLVPMKYFELSHTIIDNDVKRIGIREIPGIEIWSTEDPVIR